MEELDKKCVLLRAILYEPDFTLLYIIVNISVLVWLTTFCLLLGWTVDFCFAPPGDLPLSNTPVANGSAFDQLNVSWDLQLTNFSSSPKINGSLFLLKQSLPWLINSKSFFHCTFGRHCFLFRHLLSWREILYSGHLWKGM